MDSIKTNPVLQQLKEHIVEYYGGDTKRVFITLDDILFMLFYLEDEIFTKEEIQRAANNLKQLRDCFMVE